MGEFIGTRNSKKKVTTYLGKGLGIGVVWDLRVEVLREKEGVVRVFLGGGGGGFDFKDELLRFAWLKLKGLVEVKIGVLEREGEVGVIKEGVVVEGAFYALGLPGLKRGF